MRTALCMLGVLVLTGLSACQPASSDVEIRVQDGVVYLDHWTPSSLSDEGDVKLYVWDEALQAPNEPAVAGELVTVPGGGLVFAPLFPLDTHTSYLLTIDDASFKHLIEGAVVSSSPPRITQFYPSRDALPENLLRMYVQFSQPMNTTGNLERIRIIDEEGGEVANAIFNNVYELWNADQTQLTLLFDPARVKTGLEAHGRYGRALRAGRSYTLEVEGLKDVHGVAMVDTFRKAIHVTAEDRLPPAVDRWTLDIPESRSHSAFVVRFSDVVDYLSLHNSISLTTASGAPVSGTVTLDENETAWMFAPEEPWVSGTYVLQVNARLEDPAGNNLNGLFDHKAGSLRYKKEGERIPVEFVIGE